ncbi:MAG TPA: hypothetical protein VGK74_19650 [Symbiobacteriaceae bacterium]|jgi:hypothetical protein
MGGVFTEYPQLRPVGRRQCVITPGINAKGKPCLVIALNTAVIKRRTTRGSTNTDNPAPAPKSADQVAAAKETAAKETAKETAAKETPREVGQ